MLVVLDTNILVSALLSPLGASGRILDLALIGDLQIAYDDRILSEYRDVLARPKFGFAPDDVRDLLDYLIATGELVIPRPLVIELPDPSDLPFLEAAAEAHAPLITGNTSHYGQAALNLSLFTPRAFMESWRNG